MRRLVFSLSLLAALSCTREPAGVQRLPLTACRVEGVARQVLCGVLEVPEDRAAAKGRKIPLRVVVVPALAASPDPDPLFILAGGPGQAASELTAPLLSVFDRATRTRDLVLVDQRGTGASNPLDCEVIPEDAPLADQLDDRFPEAEYRACLAGFDADPRHYTTPVAMEDLDAVRAALGYSKINLWGASYGTRAALVYLRDHGEHVRSVILDGVAPMSLLLPLFIPRDTDRALETLFGECAQSAACASAYPRLRDQFESLLARLESQPARVIVDHPHTGKQETITVSRDTFTATLRGLLYLPEASSLLPRVVSAAAAGDFRPFVAVGSSMGGSLAKNLSQGMFLSVVCSEDAPFITEEAISREAQGTWLGEGAVKRILQACEFWPRGELPAGYRDPVSSEVPVLLLSGELDPVTPPSWAEDAKKTLPNSLHVALPGVGHGASSFGCVRQLIARFLESASVADLANTCDDSLVRPPFFTTFAGPTP